MSEEIIPSIPQPETPLYTTLYDVVSKYVELDTQNGSKKSVASLFQNYLDAFARGYDDAHQDFIINGAEVVIERSVTNGKPQIIKTYSFPAERPDIACWSISTGENDLISKMKFTQKYPSEEDRKGEVTILDDHFLVHRIIEQGIKERLKVYQKLKYIIQTIKQNSALFPYIESLSSFSHSTDTDIMYEFHNLLEKFTDKEGEEKQEQNRSNRNKGKDKYDQFVEALVQNRINPQYISRIESEINSTIRAAEIWISPEALTGDETSQNKIVKTKNSIKTNLNSFIVALLTKPDQITGSLPNEITVTTAQIKSASSFVDSLDPNGKILISYKLSESARQYAEFLAEQHNINLPIIVEFIANQIQTILSVGIDPSTSLYNHEDTTEQDVIAAYETTGLLPNLAHFGYRNAIHIINTIQSRSGVENNSDLIEAVISGLFNSNEDWNSNKDIAHTTKLITSFLIKNLKGDQKQMVLNLIDTKIHLDLLNKFLSEIRNTYLDEARERAHKEIGERYTDKDETSLIKKYLPEERKDKIMAIFWLKKIMPEIRSLRNVAVDDIITLIQLKTTDTNKKMSQSSILQIAQTGSKLLKEYFEQHSTGNILTDLENLIS